MNATEAQIEERVPVWEALSEIFLDTELQPDDHARIAKILAESRFTEEEIEEILIGEVCPVCRVNFFHWEWEGFDRGWLKKEISQCFGRRPRFMSLFKFMHAWMYVRDWNKIKALIYKIRVQC